MIETVPQKQKFPPLFNFLLYFSLHKEIVYSKKYITQRHCN